MQIGKTHSRSLTNVFASKLADYKLLTKLRLSSLVIFSALIGYLLATGGAFNALSFSMLAIGGFLVTASANALNQVIERESDKLMNRTEDRPLPTGRMSITEALLFAGVAGVIGLSILGFYFNPLTAMLGALALFSYAFVYTPLKKITPIAVLIGAVPGALPPLIGFAAVTGSVGFEAWVLFAIQFIWQFPHFWAIAWVADDDYIKANIRLLPSSSGKTKHSAIHNIVYTLALVGLGVMVLALGFIKIIPAIIIIAAGLLFLIQAIQLFIKCDDASAKKLMFGSFIYLPVVQIAIILNLFL